MKFPKRGPTHEIEAESWRLFTRDAPANWIVRQVTERDYGIDAYIEMATLKQDVTGELFMGQLKGTAGIDWTTDNSFNFPGVAKETINYWLGLPVPVFLFVVDTIANQVYWVAVKEVVRRRYLKFVQQDSLGFPLHKKFSLGTQLGQEAFVLSYFREKFYSQFETYARDLVMRWDNYREFILSNQCRDHFLEVEPEAELTLQHLYATLKFLSEYCDLEWPVVSLMDLYKEDRAAWKDEYIRLHEQSMDRVLSEIQKVYPTIVYKVAERISKDEFDYWLHKNRVLTELAMNLAANKDRFVDMR